MLTTQVYLVAQQSGSPDLETQICFDFISSNKRLYMYLESFFPIGQKYFSFLHDFEDLLGI